METQTQDSAAFVTMTITDMALPMTDIKTSIDEKENRPMTDIKTSMFEKENRPMTDIKTSMVEKENRPTTDSKKK